MESTQGLPTAAVDEATASAIPAASQLQAEQQQQQQQQQASTTGTNDDEDDEGDEDDDEADGGNELVLQPGGTLTSKQRKKKKSKAAAKLRKKAAAVVGSLGGGGSGSAGTSKSADSAPALSDDQVTQIQKAVAASQGPEAAAKVDRANLAKVMQLLNLERSAMMKSQEEKQKGAKAIADHKFWKTQPVTKPDDTPLHSTAEEGPIEPNVPPSEVRQEPYPLPKDFEWVMIDIDDEVQLKEVYDLLSANYVEDDDASLRFAYSPEFLHWVLKHPGYRKKWHIGVRVSSTQKLVAFISGIPHELRVRESAFHSAEINFLCVHKKLRSKRLAPVLIKEVTRQIHLTGIFQAIYTAGVVIPTPMSCARYYHRTVNASKLLEVGFSGLPHGMSKERYIARFDLPTTTSVAGLREMKDEDVPAVGKLMRRYMRRFDMAPRFSDEEVRHVLLSGRGKRQEGKSAKQVTWTYVVENTEGRITDFFSFYSLPSSILDNEKHKVLNAAYLFYYASDSVFQDGQEASGSAADASSSSSAADLPEWQRSAITDLSAEEQKDEKDVTPWNQESEESKRRLKARLNELISDLLVIAKQNDFDVVNCLTVMDNPSFLAEQKFGPGDGFLRFYLFNWRVQPVAGGLGSRPGEAELDPVVQHLKQTATAASSDGDEASRLSTALNQARRAAEWGSGNGVVMV